MQIQKIILPYSRTSNLTEKKPTNSENNTPVRQTPQYAQIDYFQIPFCAMNNITPKKLLDTNLEKNKLLKQLNEMLDVLPEDMKVEDLLEISERQMLSHYRNTAKRLFEIQKKINAFQQDFSLTPKQRSMKATALLSELNKLKIKKPTIQKPIPKARDEKIDYQLLNRLKAAISEDDFGLKKIYVDYYKDLENITSIDELTKKYPKIKIPPRPEQIVAKKIADTLTRDFYEEFERLSKIDLHEAFNFSNSRVQQIIDSIAKKFDVDAESLYMRVGRSTLMEIVDRYKTAKQKGFSIFNTNIKNPNPTINENDIKLLCVDFDDFVLHVVKKHYLESEKINTLVYSFNETTIPLRSLSNSDYKFGKLPEKIRSIINQGEAIKASQRAYDLFDIDKLHQRLNLYGNSTICDNEKMLEYIINFSSCRKEDRPNLIKLLRELDEIQDGNKTIKESLKTIEEEEIFPKETVRLDEIERQKAIESYRLEQKRLSRLNHYKNEFNKVIDFLYLNDLNDIANMCSKYCPEDLEPETVANAEYIIKIIRQCITDGEKVDKDKLKTNLTNWDSYKYYEKNDPNNAIFKQARLYATDEDGNIDINKAGQYIINSEILENYPETLNYLSQKEKELLKTIMTRTNNNKTQALKYLCKLSEYRNLDSSDKTQLANFIDNFDMRDQIEKLILKYIIENDYINIDTQKVVPLNENSTQTIKATFGSTAKQQIIEKYKYPVCLEFLKAFEDALSLIATSEGSSGIKHFGRSNNGLEYTMELKLKGHDDRLFSSENNYYFDIFSERGLH